jgi:hypothetical protein
MEGVGDVDDIRRLNEEDAKIEAAVLRQLIVLHPIQLTLDEVVREVAGEEEGFALRDAVERAVRELVAAGLAHRSGDVVRPSRAALRCEELLG